MPKGVGKAGKGGLVGIQHLLSQNTLYYTLSEFGR